MRQSLQFLFRTLALLISWALALLTHLGKGLAAPPLLLAQLLINVPLTLLHVRQPLRPRLIPLMDAELPDAAWVFLTDATEALTATGFVLCGNFRCDEWIPGATLWSRLLVQHEQGIVALIAYAEFDAGSQRPQPFAEFLTEFADGRVLDTHNRALSDPLPTPGYLARLRLTEVCDPRALYVLHRDLVASLPQAIRPIRIEQAARDPASLLTDPYTREMETLIEEGWMRAVSDQNQARFSLRGATHCVWRRAWPLASLYRHLENRYSYRLLAEQAIDAARFTGAAAMIVVDRQPFPMASDLPVTVWAGYEKIRLLARRTDPNAILEAVIVDLESDSAGLARPSQFRYAFRSNDLQYERRIRRLHRFDILLDPKAAILAMTAMHRGFLKANNPTEWLSVANPPLPLPLRLGPWLFDLDAILLIALNALRTQADTQDIQLNSALLLNDHNSPFWRMIAQTANDKSPLSITINAYTGLIKV